MILLIDNYDSFVHNLARYVERLGQPTVVMRNDSIDARSVEAMRPTAIVLSPGPCTPNDAGASLEIVRLLHNSIPMLGVCLGHQVIAEALGGRVCRARIPVHGRASAITHKGTGLFDGLPSPLQVGRYHSLLVETTSLPTDLRPTAWSDESIVMAIEHARLPLFGVQFHPESILTECGYALLANFLRLARLNVVGDPGELARGELRTPIAYRQPLPAGPVTF